MPVDQPPPFLLPPSAYIASGPVASIGLTFSSSMAVITNDGKVTIDWKRVQEVASAPDDAWHDRTSAAIAKLMLAIRDHTYDQVSHE